MTQTRLSLSWKAFKNNFCDGLSSLQQREEFVDMTLAADGHFVKVHQMVLSLASPYLKELIKSAPCPHPVLFLNQISYQTLCSILEYIYSGEVLINKEHLSDLLQAGKALHINGLDIENTEVDNVQIVDSPGGQVTLNFNEEKSLPDTIKQQPYVKSLLDTNKKRVYNKMETSKNSERVSVDVARLKSVADIRKIKVYPSPSVDMDTSMMNMDDFASDMFDESIDDPGKSVNVEQYNTDVTSTDVSSKPTNQPPSVQYTLSNQGNIQMILNRYLYYIRYSYKKGDSARLWRCVEYVRGCKCRATVITENDMVVQRVRAHNHPFHDKRIMKKLNSGTVFTAIKEAEDQGQKLANKDDKATKSKSDPLAK